MIRSLIISLLLLVIPQFASAQFGKFMKKIDKRSLPDSRTLQNEKINAGLRETLSVGTENAVKLTGNADGFLKVVHYGIPPSVEEPTFDPDDHLVEKGFDGLFHDMAQEEQQISKNPVTRTTGLFQEIINKQSEFSSQFHRTKD